MTDTMRAVWARRHRPIPRPQRYVPVPGHAYLVPAGPAPRHGDLVPIAEYMATRDATAEPTVRTVLGPVTEARRRLGEVAKLEGGSGPGVMGADNGADVRFEGPA